jgi:hypothetical protein
MRRKRTVRKWDELSEEDPGAGLLNLFDVWIAFAVALLLAMLSYSKVSNAVSEKNVDQQKSEQKVAEDVNKKRLPLERYKASTAKLSGEGERLGTAYRLKNGEVVYVPDL